MKHFWGKVKFLIEKAMGWINKAIGPRLESNQMDERAWVALINEALQDWKAAQNNFNFFSDSDLVDYSIFSINAAEKRYLHLIRKARELNVIANFPEFKTLV